MQENNNNNPAPRLKPFSNPITGSILGFLIGMLLLGAIMASHGNFWGVVLVAISLLIYTVGKTEHPNTNPRTAGLLTMWGTPIKIGKEYMVVGGTTILLDFFPFSLETIKVDIENKERKFPMTVLSGDKSESGKDSPIPMEGLIALTLRANIADLFDYVQAGNDMTKIFDQLDDIVYRQTQAICRDMTGLDIQRKGDEIGAKLWDHLNGTVFEQGSFGVETIKIQSRFSMPKGVLDDMTDAARETYQREAASREYRTTMISAEALQVFYQQDPTGPDRIPSREECVSAIKDQLLIMGGRKRVVAIQTEGTNTGGITIANLRIDMKDEKKGEK
jgi:hypothetical protein